MVYNPIFEEEIDRKKELKELKKEIKNRHRQQTLKEVIDRVYHLLQRKPILTLTTLFHPLLDMIRTAKAKEI